EEQEQPVARWRLVRAHQGWMLMRTPLVEAEQDGSIRIQDLTKVVVARRGLGLPKERLVPSEAARNVAYADDRPCAFHRISAVGLSFSMSRGARARIGAIGSIAGFGGAGSHNRQRAIAQLLDGAIVGGVSSARQRTRRLPR